MLAFESFLSACNLLSQAGGGTGPTPGANRYADATTVGFVEIRNAFIKIDIPLLKTTHQLLVIGDGTHRAGIDAHLAACTKTIRSKFINFISKQR